MSDPVKKCTRLRNDWRAGYIERCMSGSEGGSRKPAVGIRQGGGFLPYKTTTAVTLASGLSRMNYKVLLIDLDTQGNVADSLGLPHGDDLRRLLSPDLNFPLDQAVTPSGVDNLDIIRSDKSTTALKQTLAGVTLREYILADVLASAAYDLIVLDCAPTVDLLHFAALVAADYLLIPHPVGQAGGERGAGCAPDLIRIEAHQPMPGGRYPPYLLRTGHPGKSRAIDPPGADLRPAGAAPHPAGYPMTQCRVATRYGKTLWEHAPNAKALNGYEQGSKLIGGYIQVLERIKELL